MKTKFRRDEEREIFAYAFFSLSRYVFYFWAPQKRDSIYHPGAFTFITMFAAIIKVSGDY